nr:MAG TPA: hypothetical protein [Bacteriophage sp.]
MGTTYYYEPQTTNYPPYLAHYGVKGMKWGIRNDPDHGLYRNLQRYNKNKTDGYYRAHSRYKRSKKALRAKRRKRQISYDGYLFGEEQIKKTKRRAKSAVRRDAREEYYSKVSRGRGIATSALLMAGGRKLYRTGIDKTMENAVSDDGHKYIAWAFATGVGATMLGSGVTGGYLEVRRGARDVRQKIRRE